MKKCVYLFLIVLILVTACGKKQAELPIDDTMEEASAVAVTPAATGAPASETADPSVSPTVSPTVTPTATPTITPIKETAAPTPTPSPVPSETPTPAPTETPEQKKDMVTLYVKGKDSVIFPKTEIEYKENQTVFDLLKEVMRQNNIIVDDTGVGTNKYVEGIDNLYEFDHGAKSGWVYFVNGKMMDRSSGQSIVSKNDKISWYYTLDLGNDIIPD